MISWRRSFGGAAVGSTHSTGISPTIAAVLLGGIASARPVAHALPAEAGGRTRLAGPGARRLASQHAGRGNSAPVEPADW
jgi:hypothetical protein